MSNHFGDTNKMVDETPRTNQVSIRPQYGDEWDWCRADFSRQLERELNAANDEIERLRKSNLQLREGAEEQKHRIKRLEEAYSATEAVRTIRDCWCNHDPDTWTRCSTCCDKIKRYHAAKANLNRTEEAKEAKL